MYINRDSICQTVLSGLFRLLQANHTCMRRLKAQQSAALSLNHLQFDLRLVYNTTYRAAFYLGGWRLVRPAASQRRGHSLEKRGAAACQP